MINKFQVGDLVHLPAFEDNPDEYGKVIEVNKDTKTYIVEVDEDYLMNDLGTCYDDGLREVAMKEYPTIPAMRHVDEIPRKRKD